MQTDHLQPAESGKQGPGLIKLSILAIGIVYGDIGTSPIYAIRECFYGEHRIDASGANILGILSLVFWSLILVISIKYLLIILRADHRGEGGILALMELVRPKKKGHVLAVISTLGIFGAALLYGDGVITPAISVLSAVEGLKIATPLFEPFVVPITIAILILLFLFQKKGTSKVGAIFGPVTLIWFTTIALIGLSQIIKNPDILVSLNPYYAINFFVQNGTHALIILGVVVLVVTGGEALYADIGHFGKAPIRLAWFVFVLPCLILNYMGQGAFLLANPDMIASPFYLMAPAWSLYPLVILATIATIIASQAVISGAFSLTFQAIQLGYLPRLVLKHTSDEKEGQIYLPQVNSLLMLGTIAVVIGFKTSGNLASAYGLAITMTMTITSILAFIAMNKVWKWGLITSILLTLVFVTIDLSFLGSNLTKITSGGWFPLAVGIAGFLMMTTWQRGRRYLAVQLKKISPPIKSVIKDYPIGDYMSVKGTAIYMTRDFERTPPAFMQNLRHNKVLHEKIIILSILTSQIPHIDRSKRLQVDQMSDKIYRVKALFGFMDQIDVENLMNDLQEHNQITLDLNDVSFIVGRETLIPDANIGMSSWRDKLFVFMSKNATRATTFYNIPQSKAFEIGTQVTI
ncbi:MAG: potassium transporter Kup [Chloroflexota bacterium]|nr:potassium transporter Kup [Lentimicrobium sp.]